jgi:hypothetical protein
MEKNLQISIQFFCLSAKIEIGFDISSGPSAAALPADALH